MTGQDTRQVTANDRQVTTNDRQVSQLIRISYSRLRALLLSFKLGD